MPTIPIFQVDAFTDKLFGGNPAAVCVLDEWLDDKLMQQIGAENNLSETAFVVPKEDHYEITWFTPESEVELCGHATLASAYVLFNFYHKEKKSLEFNTRHRGWLEVQCDKDMYTLDFPADVIEPVEAPEAVVDGIRKMPMETWKGKTDYLLVFETEEDILKLAPDFTILKNSGARGVMVTAPGNDVDFVSRFFAPLVGINEDPVTGSAHTSLIPYWAFRLDKTTLEAKQVSKRGGRLHCKLEGDRVKIGGRAKLFFRGEINL
jgi:PhzF family phenazine biosynthesis protein